MPSRARRTVHERFPPEGSVTNLPLERLKSYLRSVPDVDMAFLFGSFAKGSETKRSENIVNSVCDIGKVLPRPAVADDMSDV